MATNRRLTVAHLVDEKGFMQAVKDVARARGWLVYHNFDARRSDPGFPDLLMVRGDRIVAMECKTMRGKVTAAQEAWLKALSDAGATAMVVRPDMWDQIHEVLG